MKHNRKGKFRRYWLRYRNAFLVVVTLTAGMQVIDAFGWLEGLQATALDTMFRGKANTAWNDIFIVEITNEDYKAFFRSTSPLDPETLATLIERITPGKPSVIGVDVDTSDEQWCCRQSTKLGTAIVWAQVPSESESRLNQKEPVLLLQPVCGGQIEDQSQMGIPRFPLDRDGVVRRYISEFPVVGATGPCIIPPNLSHEECNERLLTKRRAAPTNVAQADQLQPRPMKSLARVILEKYKNYMGDKAQLPEGGSEEVLLNFSR